MNKEGASLENNQVITKNGLSSLKLPEGFDFVNMSKNGEVIATNYNNTLIIGSKRIPTKDAVIAASVEDDYLALLYYDNSIELRNLKTGEKFLREYSSVSLSNDTRVANPYFMKSLILFPTLDGKIIVVSKKTNKIVRTIIVDSKDKFNNIIFLNVLKGTQTLIAASPNHIVSIEAKDQTSKTYELRDIITHNKNIFIATLDGKIIKLSESLKELANKKFDYAKFHALTYSNGYLYAIEKQGYTIKLNDDLSVAKIYDFSFNNEKRLLAIDNKIYNEDIITLP